MKKIKELWAAFVKNGGKKLKSLGNAWEQARQWNISIQGWKIRVHKGPLPPDPMTAAAPSPVATTAAPAASPTPVTASTSADDDQSEATGPFLLIIVATAVLMVAVLGIGYYFQPSASSQDGTRKGFSVLWAVLGIFSVIATIVWLARGINAEEQTKENKEKTWWSQMKEVHPETGNALWIGMGVAVGLAIIQWVAHETGFRGYDVILHHKSFWAINVALLITPVVLSITKHATVKRVMRFVLAGTLIATVCIGSTAYWPRDASAAAQPEHFVLKRYPSDGELYPKGSYSPSFPVERIVDLTATDQPVFVKINGSDIPIQIQPKPVPGTARKNFELPSQASGGTVSYSYPDRDFYVMVRVPAPQRNG